MGIKHFIIMIKLLISIQYLVSDNLFCKNNFQFLQNLTYLIKATVEYLALNNSKKWLCNTTTTRRHGGIINYVEMTRHPQQVVYDPLLLVCVGTVSDHNEIMGLCWTKGQLNNRYTNKQDHW